MTDQQLTSDQYRRLAEGLLKSALNAPTHQKEAYIRDALAYLGHARTKDLSREPSSLDDQIDQEAYARQVSQVRALIKQALEAPTVDDFVNLLTFGTKFRRLSAWNAYMAYIQRPGARIIATEYEWKKRQRFIKADAVPIIILWPSSPIRLIYELEDTSPDINRDVIGDPFAVEGRLNPKVVPTLLSNLCKQKAFMIEVEYRRRGFDSAGSAAAQGVLPIDDPSHGPLNGSSLGEFAAQNAEVTTKPSARRVPSYRITVNDRLETKHRFVTIAHELGHIFCGHLGGCSSGSNVDEGGWPNRTQLGKHEKEIEAEAVAYLVAARAGIIPASATYLKAHASRADLSLVDQDIIIRSAARVERLANIRHGSMEFK
jgi:hypothetical protein